MSLCFWTIVFKFFFSQPINTCNPYCIIHFIRKYCYNIHSYHCIFWLQVTSFLGLTLICHHKVEQLIIQYTLFRLCQSFHSSGYWFWLPSSSWQQSRFTVCNMYQGTVEKKTCHLKRKIWRKKGGLLYKSACKIIMNNSMMQLFRGCSNIIIPHNAPINIKLYKFKILHKLPIKKGLYNNISVFHLIIWRPLTFCLFWVKTS